MARFLFMPESAYGPTNNCIGVGNILRQRGHTVIFAAEASWEGRLEPLGFVEDLVHLAEPAAADPDAPPEAAGQFWIDFIRDTAPVFRTPTIEQLTGFIQPTWQALIDGAQSDMTASGDVLSFRRSGDDETLFVAVNLSSEPAEIAAPSGAWQPTGAGLGSVGIVNGKLRLGPWGVSILQSGR
jgi:hypothetical protein